MELADDFADFYERKRSAPPAVTKLSERERDVATSWVVKVLTSRDDTQIVQFLAKHPPSRANYEAAGHRCTAETTVKEIIARHMSVELILHTMLAFPSEIASLGVDHTKLMELIPCADADRAYLHVEKSFPLRLRFYIAMELTFPSLLFDFGDSLLAPSLHFTGEMSIEDLRSLEQVLATVGLDRFGETAHDLKQAMAFNSS